MSLLKITGNVVRGLPLNFFPLRNEIAFHCFICRNNPISTANMPENVSGIVQNLKGHWESVTFVVSEWLLIFTGYFMSKIFCGYFLLAFNCFSSARASTCVVQLYLSTELTRKLGHFYFRKHSSEYFFLLLMSSLSPINLSVSKFYQLHI